MFLSELTFVFLVSGRVDSIETRLQIIPGEERFTCPPLQSTQLLKIPEHETHTNNLYITVTGGCDFSSTVV